jgi:hypothetical protein
MTPHDTSCITVYDFRLIRSVSTVLYKLNVFFSDTPIVVLRFGSSKKANFSEGESLLMECHVKSNPPLNAITWFHQVNNIFFDSIGIHWNKNL